MEIKKLVLTLLLFSIVFSQQIISSEILSTIIGAITVIAVIVILLYLGGVIKERGLGTGFIVGATYIIIIVIIFVLPLLQRLGYINIFPDRINSETLKKWGFPQNDAYKFPKEACQVLTILTLQEQIACYVPEIIFLVILPFAAIFAICYGFLNQLKIFKGAPNEDKLYRLLAFIMAFSTIPMGIFMILVAFWFSFMGIFSLAVFVAMFIAGVFFRGYGFVAIEYTRAVQTSMKIRSELKQLLLEELAALKGKGVDEKYEKLAEFLEKDTVKQFFSRSEIDNFKEKLSKIDRKQQDAADKINNLIDEIKNTLRKR